MTFFEDRHGHFHPISRIHRIAEKPATGKPNLYTHRVYMKDGGDFDGLDIDASTVRFIRQSAAAVLPATPGTYLLQFAMFGDDNADEARIWRMPVLGWRVGGEYVGVEPIVMDPNFEGMTGQYAILHPNGIVETASGEYYEEEASWSAECVRQALLTAKRKGGEG